MGERPVRGRANDNGLATTSEEEIRQHTCWRHGTGKNGGVFGLCLVNNRERLRKDRCSILIRPLIKPRRKYAYSIGVSRL